jgi:Uma2 family endonuclease
MMVALPPGLLEAPELALYQEQIRALLDEERLRREKFRQELSPSVKAEFINGEIIVHSPAMARHIIAKKNLLTLLDAHVKVHRLGLVLDEKALIALTRNDYEPDINFFSTPKAGSIQPDQHIFPVPDFIVEVLSASTESRDRGIKFRDYAAHGVHEYWLVDPDAEIVEQYENAEGQYKLLLKQNSGTIASRVVQGFEVPARAIFDSEENLSALRRLLSASGR